MDNRAAKLALARKKLRDHQDKKLSLIQKDNNEDSPELTLPLDDHIYQSTDQIQDHMENYNIVELNKQDIPPDVIKSDLHHINNYEPNTNVTEILISNKRNLEQQITELQTKYNNLTLNYSSVIENLNLSNQKINDLENELQTLNVKYSTASENGILNEQIIEELNNSKSSWQEEKCNLLEQLEVTKNILTAKETENDLLLSKLNKFRNQLDRTQLQLDQLTNGCSTENSFHTVSLPQQQNEELKKKITMLQNQVQAVLKEKDQMNGYYRQYESEMNQQLELLTIRNNELNRELQELSNSENSLIDQVSAMEVRLQQYIVKPTNAPPIEKEMITADNTNYQQMYEKLQGEMLELNNKCEELQRLNEKSNAKIIELTQIKESDCSQDNISISKLNADITSDKIAAQRATEQNKKLKQDVHGLEDAFVKMSTDKLELTEKLTAEKYLNRELTIKLAEIEEKTKDMFVKLKAKDEEMIRLQSSYRDMEKKVKDLSHNSCTQETQIETPCDHSTHLEKCLHDHEENEDITVKRVEEHDSENSCFIDRKDSVPKDDAMVKLQDRFLKIMDEVANLSDEKHRLEHIILQLQNETDTICEYVALYQQQRSLLKKRDEERSAQIKMFQTECDKLKSHLNELSQILRGFENDKELFSYFQVESKRKELQRAMNLLSDLKSNSLIDSEKNIIEFKDFYPCSCCSGQLIDV